MCASNLRQQAWAHWSQVWIMGDCHRGKGSQIRYWTWAYRDGGRSLNENTTSVMPRKECICWFGALQEGLCNWIFRKESNARRLDWQAALYGCGSFELHNLLTERIFGNGRHSLMAVHRKLLDLLGQSGGMCIRLHWHTTARVEGTGD